MKPTTIEELNELRAWFNSQELPATMYIDKATYTPNLRETIDMLFDQSYLYYENPKMQGSILLLRRIKANLEKEK
jgi:hypothetical protein